MSSARILIAEDDDASRQLLIDYLQQEGYEVEGVPDGEAALSKIQSQITDVLITDLKMPKLDGMSLLSKVKRENPAIAVLVMTGYASVNTAVKAMKLGAEDYITKPVNLEELRILLHKAIEKQAIKSENVILKQQLKDRYPFQDIVGQSELMEKVFQLIEKIADSDSTVIVYGESGTGKELLARAIHCLSHRSNKPLVPVNCGAIPEELLESELFGHEKGAFTGAHKARIGRFEVADGGTIFLDEIGDMSPNLQVKILRVLQQREFEKVGSVYPIKVDIRVIAATHRDLEKAVAEGKFREDLFYRLNVIPVVLPPLRERKSDIPLLISYFIDQFNKTKGKEISEISSEALECFMKHNWPGNIRELQNMIERLVILKDSGVIEAGDLPDRLLNGPRQNLLSSVCLQEEGACFSTMVTDFEKQLIHQALRKTSGVKNKAAKLLNMNRTTLVEKMKKLQIKYNP
jgi:DNA-binding NtrC family response regulator